MEGISHTTFDSPQELESAEKLIILHNHYRNTMESSLTLKFRGVEAELLDRMVRSGLFATKSEAIRAALVKYGADLGLLRTRDLWTSIKKHPRRRIPIEKLREKVRKAEDAE